MEETLEITNYFEPVLSKPEQDYAHQAFNNLFITFENLEKDNILVKRKKRGVNDKDIYLAVNLYTEHETVGDFEYEINQEKFLGKRNTLIPELVEDSKPYSKTMGLVTEPCLATKRTIKIKPSETIIIDLILSISNNKEEAISALEKYKNEK